ncbi:maleylpyruvate isomerase family mycothiol-dependent enzyme [Streptomyces chumphonensis]|uniref:maleylpyruvate isomerase family mycothiol-dependent enzyme n=1 Tax=Streptomyces chumphonensis TaxID=1214925 RepID=UPI003D721CE9
MRTTDHLHALTREGEALISAAERAGWDATVPTCPGWRVRDLVVHQGHVHRWAADTVAERRAAPVPRSSDDVPDATLARWYREGHARLLDTLSGAPEDVECWTFLSGSPTPLAFWARRQAHETAIHRVDAELAAGMERPEVDAALAADGIDELLAGLLTRERSRLRAEKPCVLRVRTRDAGAGRTWTVRITSAVPAVTEGGQGRADCTVSGPASLLYTALWNRAELTTATVEGDPGLAARWRELSAV